MALYRRKEIPFDDKLASLWSKAYSEIVSIVKDSQMINKEIVFPLNNYIKGIIVSSDGCIELIKENGERDIVENFDDEWIYYAYNIVYHSLVAL